MKIFMTKNSKYFFCLFLKKDFSLEMYFPLQFVSSHIYHFSINKFNLYEFIIKHITGTQCILNHLACSKVYSKIKKAKRKHKQTVSQN